MPANTTFWPATTKSVPAVFTKGEDAVRGGRPTPLAWTMRSAEGDAVVSGSLYLAALTNSASKSGEEARATAWRGGGVEGSGREG